MPHFAFERPFFTLVALLAPLIIMVIGRFFRGAFSLALSLGPPGGEVFKAPFSAGFWGRLCKIASVAGVVLLLLAASGPIAVTPAVVWLDRGADILFVLDSSPSMSAVDIGGKRRFDAAAALVRDFAAARPADAIGLIAVGNDAALLIPPTTDRTALITKLDALQIGELGDGTALGTGLSIAALHLAGSRAPRRAAVLITDGENNAGSIHPETAAETLAEKGISLYIIAAGTLGEVPIDYVDPVTKIRRTGSFDSRYNPDTLVKIAAAGRGMFFPAPSAQALAGAFEQIKEAEMVVSRQGVREKKAPLHHSLVIAGAMLAALGFLFKKIMLGALF